MGLAATYHPHHPDQTLLYQVIAEHLETFLARQAERDRTHPGRPREVALDRSTKALTLQRLSPTNNAHHGQSRHDQKQRGGFRDLGVEPTVVVSDVVQDDLFTNELRTPLGIAAYCQVRT